MRGPQAQRHVLSAAPASALLLPGSRAQRPFLPNSEPHTQLSGNAAKDLRTATVTERHLLLAVRGDEELDKLFPGHVRNGGMVPHILKSIVAAAKGPLSDFDRRFVALLRASAVRVEGGARFAVAVDPRDGRHYALALDGGEEKEDGVETETDDGQEEEEEYEPTPLPLLDACCALPAEGRRKAARAALPADARAALDAECGPGGAPAAGPRRAAQLRLRQIRAEQRRTDPCLDAAAFRRLVEAAARGESDAAEAPEGGGLVWTGEALAALQAAAEAMAMSLGESAAMGALRCAGRVLVSHKDVVQAIADFRSRF